MIYIFCKDETIAKIWLFNEDRLNEKHQLINYLPWGGEYYLNRIREEEIIILETFHEADIHWCENIVNILDTMQIEYRYCEMNKNNLIGWSKKGERYVGLVLDDVRRRPEMSYVESFEKMLEKHINYIISQDI